MTQEHTPLMQQYFAIKQHYATALLFFQVGDFYELFFDDAKKASSFLGIALTTRGKNKGEPIPLCGVPLHAVDHYLTKLVRGGFTVAICDQLELPKPGTVVKRGVTQVLTPGTLTDTRLLDEKSASYLCSFAPTDNGWGFVCAEVLTGQLLVSIIEPSEKQLESELATFVPDEVLIPNLPGNKPFFALLYRLGFTATAVDADTHLQQDMQTWVQHQFSQDVQAMLVRSAAIQSSLYYFYAYLAKNQPMALREFTGVQFYRSDDFLMLDAATQRNLELCKNVHDGSRKHTLLESIDAAVTPMGSRLLKKWLQRPLINKEAIMDRQAVVARLLEKRTFAQALQDQLRAFGDLERVVGRIVLGRGQLFDYLHVARALSCLPMVQQLLIDHYDLTLIQIIAKQFSDCTELKNLLKAALNDDRSKEYLIREGFDSSLDRLRMLVTQSQQTIAALERQEQDRTGIGSLKIRYNQVQGYYIEVTKTNMHLVPQEYRRLQTLVGKERYMTPELHQLQAEIMQAHTEIGAVEAALYDRVKKTVSSYNRALRKIAYALAHLDALFAFSSIAYERAYVCPTITEDRVIDIVDGRHPVIECNQSPFIPNDTRLDDEQSLWIITGPNMGGKSTYLRQVAHICLLAHCGSYVPATKATIAILDRIFTRIGSGDNLAEGKSTFLVEMEETAAICTQSTNRSLVILDEVGRGTSTFDGLALAQAVVEYLFTHIGARCLFATHYHELTHLQEGFPGIVSYYAASKKTQNGILFLYKMVRGVADGSFGVEVAKLAHLPPRIIKRAEQLLLALTGDHPKPEISISGPPAFMVEPAVSAREQEILAQLKGISLEDLTPRQALDLLWRWRG